MKEQMRPENLNNKEKEIDYSEMVFSHIEKILAEAPVNKNKREFLLEKLNADYGEKLTKEIIELVPEEIFLDKNEVEMPTVAKEPIKSDTEILDEVIKKILIRIEGLSEKKQMAEVERILIEEYQISVEKMEEIKKSPAWKKFFTTKYTLGVVGVLALGMALKSLNIDLEKLNVFNKDKKKELKKEIPKPEIKKKEMATFDLRFNNELYKSLPEQAKEVYKFMAEYNPTPGRCYQILDKENAALYIFSPKNEFLAKFPAGFGKDTGDEPNTSKEYNKGKQTTPAGVYILSEKYLLSEDKKQYGDLAFAMIGISVKGDKIYLAQHQTYTGHGQFKPRTEKLDSPSSEDNRFSNGCTNISPENFESYVWPNFWGDGGEIIFVLQDKEGKQAGVVFNVNSLVYQIIPVMEEMANTEEEDYQKDLEAINSDLKAGKVNEQQAGEAIKELTSKIQRLKEKRIGIQNFLAQDIDKSKQI